MTTESTPAQSPTWREQLDAISGTPEQPLSVDEAESLKAGDAVRIVAPGGTVYVGVIEKTGGSWSKWIRVHGRTFALNRMTVCRVDAEGMQEENPPRVVLTDDEVLGYVGQLTAPLNGTPVVVTAKRIVTAALGYDPASDKTAKDFGGKSDDGWISEFINLSSLRRSLDRLADNGILRKVTHTSQKSGFRDSSVCSFPYRVSAGYVLQSDYDAAKAVYEASKNGHLIEKLRLRAGVIVAQRHEDEVDEVLAELIAEAGL